MMPLLENEPRILQKRGDECKSGEKWIEWHDWLELL
jgi:hypothetical protein